MIKIGKTYGDLPKAIDRMCNTIDTVQSTTEDLTTNLEILKIP